MASKFEIASIKYYPVVANGVIFAVLVAHWIRYDLDQFVAYVTGAGVWPAVNLAFQSKKYYFCSWHRWLLYSLIFFGVLQAMQASGIFKEFPYFVASISTISCILVATFIRFRHGRGGTTMQKATKDLIGNGKGVRLRGVQPSNGRRKETVNPSVCTLFSNLFKHSRT